MVQWSVSGTDCRIPADTRVLELGDPASCLESGHAWHADIEEGVARACSIASIASAASAIT